MTKEKIDQINRRHIRNVDKYYRMSAGLASCLCGYRNRTVYLRIEYSVRWTKDQFTTARQIAADWYHFNKELANSIYYRVEMYRMAEGGADPNSISRNSECFKKLSGSMEQLQSAIFRKKLLEPEGRIIFGKF